MSTRRTVAEEREKAKVWAATALESGNVSVDEDSVTGEKRKTKRTPKKNNKPLETVEEP